MKLQNGVRPLKTVDVLELFEHNLGYLAIWGVHGYEMETLRPSANWIIMEVLKNRIYFGVLHLRRGVIFPQ